MHGCDEDTPNPAAGAPATPKMTTPPKWILDAVRELGMVTMYPLPGGPPVSIDSRGSAQRLAAELLARLPQDAMRSLAEVVCARAALDSSDTQQCAADLVKSIMEVLAAGDTEVMSLTSLVGDAWGTLSVLGVPLGDEGRVYTLVDRIRWLSRNAEAKLRIATDDAAKAEDEVRALEARLETLCGPVARLEDEQLETPAEVERLENVLRFIGNNCDDPEMVRDFVSRGLRGKSVP